MLQLTGNSNTISAVLLLLPLVAESVDSFPSVLNLAGLSKEGTCFARNHTGLICME